MILFHHSQDEQYRFPVGAVPAGTPVRLRLNASEPLSAARVRVWNGTEEFHDMTPIGMGGWEATVTAPDKPAVWWYDFSCEDINGNAYYYGNAPDRMGGEGQMYDGNPPSFQITVYDPAYTVPEFLRKGLMYQIFPDRFFRLEPPKSDRSDVVLHEDWHDAPNVAPDPRSGDNSALDFFGGSLRGIEEKLPYLSDLGITVLYLNPIFKARSNHRYDTGDYMTVDPLNGKNEDVASLCKRAKQLGIRVILDGVFSHTGEDSLYFNRYGNYDSVGAYQSEQSPYHSWYTFKHFPDSYACWWNFPTLPEVNKSNPAYRKYINGENGVARYWLREGISGWRLDVADELPMPFLRELRRAVKAEKEDGILLGEVWEDASHKMAYGEMRSYCLGDTADSVMNYPLREVLIDFFTGKKDAGQVVRLVRSLQENYPVPFFYSLMNLPGSHDRARILNVLSDCEYTGIAHAERGKMRLTPAQRALAQERFIKMLSVITALPGIPALYYGDEAGMEGAADPFCRGTFPWDNIDENLHAQVRRLFHERRRRPILQTGFLDIAQDGSETLVITRYARGGRDAFGDIVTDAPFVLRVTRDRFNRHAE